MQPEANDKFTVQEASFQEKADADGGYGGALDAFEVGDGSPANALPSLMADDPAMTGASTDAKAGGASRGFFRRLLGWLRGDG